jgi:hypothetical protein
VPPAVASARVMLVPTHSVPGPVIAATAGATPTVITLVATAVPQLVVTV